jgi:hypothetical protein
MLEANINVLNQYHHHHHHGHYCDVTIAQQMSMLWIVIIITIYVGSSSNNSYTHSSAPSEHVYRGSIYIDSDTIHLTIIIYCAIALIYCDSIIHIHIYNLISSPLTHEYIISLCIPCSLELIYHGSFDLDSFTELGGVHR